MNAKLHTLIVVAAALAAVATSPALAHAGTESPSSYANTTAVSTQSTPSVWTPWCCAALRQASIWAHWRYRAAEQRLAARWVRLVQARQQYHACRGPWNYWYWGHVWFGPPGKYAWVPYWPRHCWGQLLWHRRAIWAYTAAKIRRDRALADWRWAQRRYRMCLQFRRWPSYYGLNTSAAMSPAARMSPAGGVALMAPSGSPDSE